MYIITSSNIYSKEIANKYVDSKDVCEYLKDIDKNYDYMTNNYKWLNGNDSCVSNLFYKVIEKFKNSKNLKYLYLIDGICANANEGISEGFGSYLHSFFYDNFDDISDYLFQNNILLISKTDNILTLIASEEIILLDNKNNKEINNRLKNIKIFFKSHIKNMSKEKKGYFDKLSKDMVVFIKKRIN